MTFPLFSFLNSYVRCWNISLARWQDRLQLLNWHKKFNRGIVIRFHPRLQSYFAATNKSSATFLAFSAPTHPPCFLLGTALASCNESYFETDVKLLVVFTFSNKITLCNHHNLCLILGYSSSLNLQQGLKHASWSCITISIHLSCLGATLEMLQLSNPISLSSSSKQLPLST